MEDTPYLLRSSATVLLRRRRGLSAKVLEGGICALALVEVLKVICCLLLRIPRGYRAWALFAIGARGHTLRATLCAGGC